MATEFLGKVDEDLVMLEFGCGRGAGTLYLSELLKIKDANGTDFHETTIQYCAKQYKYNNLGRLMNWCLIDAQFPQEEIRPKRIDLFFFIQGLHQVNNIKQFFFNTANLMKNDSKLVICDFFFGQDGLKESEYAGCNLKVTKKLNITANVQAALLRADRSMEEAEIREHVPWIVKHWAEE